MNCLDGLTLTLKRQLDRFFRFARSRSTSSRDKPATVQRQQIGVPRNVRKEEDPYSSLLALSTNDSDKAYLLHSKAKFSAARVNEVGGINSSSSNITLPTAGGGAHIHHHHQPHPPPQRSSSLAGTHQAKQQQQKRQRDTGVVAQQPAGRAAGGGDGGGDGGAEGGAGSRDSSRTGVSGRTAVAGMELDDEVVVDGGRDNE